MLNTLKSTPQPLRSTKKWKQDVFISNIRFYSKYNEHENSRNLCLATARQADGVKLTNIHDMQTVGKFNFVY